jgi:hypothetical protein
MTEAQRLARNILTSRPTSAVADEALKRYAKAIGEASGREIAFDAMTAMAGIATMATAMLATARGVPFGDALTDVFGRCDEISSEGDLPCHDANP